MRTSKDGIELIKHFEGLARLRRDGRIEAYPDPASGGDPWTIGYGTTGPDIKPGLVWTRQQCEDRLINDMRVFEQDVTRLAGDHGGQHRFDALVSFVYNLGADALRRSTLLRMHNEGDYAGAAGQFVRWDKARVNGRLRALRGLTRRREAEAKLYRGQA
jgi:GH24 family phage-related lysozyme (muramidase)